MARQADIPETTIFYDLRILDDSWFVSYAMATKTTAIADARTCMGKA
jgi:hypothetical protein